MTDQSHKQIFSDIDRVFSHQKVNHLQVGNTNAAQRKQKLKRLEKSILAYRDRIKDAVFRDLRKHPSEVDITEIYPVLSELRHARRSLSEWMRTRKVPTPLPLAGSSSFIEFQPKGNVLIISPWNFPFNLTFGPLVSAIAAGNCVIVKPSEYSPHTSALMKEMISELYEENEVALFEGDSQIGQKLTSLPFNHIYFTGSPGVGKKVMEAASPNLASLTLELGGKSPVIVDQSADIKVSARRIAVGKFVNAGQICIAPDYLLVHQNIAEQLVLELRKNIETYYSQNPKLGDSYPRIINYGHCRRLQAYLEDAREKGAKITCGGVVDASENYVSPTIVREVNDSMTLMQEEIFGPVLPVLEYENLDRAISYINGRPRPLALYVYSQNKQNIKKVIHSTRAGGSCINHTGIHYYNSYLPFGGNNHSGIGRANGYYGFLEFTDQRGVLKQNLPNALELVIPPYNRWKQKLVDFTIKYL